jgi:hypothetical protein
VAKHTSVFRGRRFRELVKDVEIALVSNLTYNSGFFQKIVVDVRSNRFALRIEMYL